MSTTTVLIVVIIILVIAVVVYMANKSKKGKKQLPQQEQVKEETQSLKSQQVDYVKELEKIILDYCEETSSYNKKPSFPITKSTNFMHDLNFDGIDIVEIQMVLEDKFHIGIPENHPFNQRSANDTNFTVGQFLSAYGL